MSPDFIAAEIGVRQLHARYTDAVWRKDFDSFGDCFAEDCEWRIAGLSLKGRAEIRAAFEKLAGRFSHVLVTLRTPILDITDGVVTGRTYVTEQNVTTDGTPYAPMGVYYERFADHGDRWRFAWRLFQTQYTGAPDFSGAFYDVEDFGPPPAMPFADAMTFARSPIA